MTPDYSRPLLFAGELTLPGSVSLLERLSSHATTVTVDPHVPGATLCARTLLTTLRRLPGVLVLDSTGLSADECDAIEEATNSIDVENPMRVGRNLHAESLRVHVGPANPMAHIRIVPDGYGAHVAVEPTEPIPTCRPANSLGAIYTAALGAAEVFKRQAAVRPDRRTDHLHLRFCPVALGEDLLAAPPLPELPAIDIGLVGLGAIGTGIALILSELPLEGSALLVDPEAFSPENRATYSLGGSADVVARPAKTLIAEAALRRFSTRRLDLAAGGLITNIDTGREVLPDVIFAGVDSREARHDVQRLWPALLIDAGTGGSMVGVANTGSPGDPCMMCLYPTPKNGESSEARLARISGLPIQRCREGDTPLLEEDLRVLSGPQKDLLGRHVGKPICGLLDVMDLIGAPDPSFEPAVAFVSLQAACLAVGRLLASLLHLKRQANFVQYDALIGPQNATQQRRGPDPLCYCGTHSDVVRVVQELRYGRRGRSALSSRAGQ